MLILFQDQFDEPVYVDVTSIWSTRMPARESLRPRQSIEDHTEIVSKRGLCEIVQGNIAVVSERINTALDEVALVRKLMGH